MYCKHCGELIDDDSTFCQHCGKSQQYRREVTRNNSDIEGLSSDENKEQKAISSEASAESFVEKRTEETSATPYTNKKRKIKPLAIIGIIAVVLVLAIGIFFLVSKGLSTPHRELSATQIANLSDSVLTLQVYDKNHDLIATGSGFVVNTDKTIVTNYHVIDQGYYVEAVSEADVHYNVVGATFFDEAADIAILQFEASTGIIPLEIADSSSAQVGDTVYAIGSPLGLKNTVSSGIISAIREEGNHSDIQMTAPISAGSSGGVLLNIYGEVIGITYASYVDGQNLNLAIPSSEFTDKLQSDLIKSFDSIASFSAPLGNSVENYSALETRLVQYDNRIYESYNSENEIIVFDENTKESSKLGIKGTNLSVYRGVLYYLSSDSTIGTYDISTGEICRNILTNYPSGARVNPISKLYISNYGITVIYKTGFLQEGLIQLSFDGKIIGRVDNLPSGIIVADADTLVGYDWESWEIVFISLSNLDSFSLPVNFKPGPLCADRYGYLYISDTTESSFRTLVKYDMYSGDYAVLDRLDASTYGCFVYGGIIYYPSTHGTMRMSVSGSGWETVNDVYSLNYICFSDDGTLYAIGTYPDAGFDKYTKYFIKMGMDGGSLEQLDSEYVEW